MLICYLGSCGFVPDRMPTIFWLAGLFVVLAPLPVFLIMREIRHLRAEVRAWEQYTADLGAYLLEDAPEPPDPGESVPSDEPSNVVLFSRDAA